MINESESVTSNTVAPAPSNSNANLPEQQNVDLQQHDPCKNCINNPNNSTTRPKRIPEKPKIARPNLIRTKLEPGETYLYCTCGFAEKQPFCDNTCKTNKDIVGWEPLEFHVDVKQTYWALCGCKQTK
eukprot:GEZU01005804.1.p1 GENE.GEZU01005804.1~~GEZU01005804.1.p1  ORF type:complete len:128 (-),score=23.85 GEZU01005804.1:320-703(-)